MANPYRSLGDLSSYVIFFEATQPVSLSETLSEDFRLRLENDAQIWNLNLAVDGPDIVYV